MQNLKLIFVLCFVSIYSFSQVIEENLYSEALGKERELKILLPRGYSDQDKKAYPVIYVLDGDYLFEIVAGNVEYYSYWQDIPESIVVGVNQIDDRENDLMYSNQNSLPIDEGAEFFEFFGKELVQHIEKNYKTEPFRVVVGHGKTANFANYYLVREDPVYNGYVVISPDFAPEMSDYLEKRMGVLEQKIFYYMAASNKDIPFIMEDTKSLNTKISQIENTNLLYAYNEIDDANHYTTPAHAIPKALDKIFFTFQPISKEEYNKSILQLESSPVEYLIEKYQEIENLFGIEKQIIINDFNAIEAAIKKKEKWEYFEDLSKLAKQQYPETLLSNYYSAMYYEKIGKPKKAMKTYRDAYVMEEIGGITKDFMLEKADAIKADFGY